SSPFVPFPGPFGIFACASSVSFPGGCTQHHPGWNLSVNLVSTITTSLLNAFSVGPSHTLFIAEGTTGNISLANNGIDLPLLQPMANQQRQLICLRPLLCSWRSVCQCTMGQLCQL